MNLFKILIGAVTCIGLAATVMTFAAMALPYWAANKPMQIGLWDYCASYPEDTTSKSCVPVENSNFYNDCKGFYAAARTFAILAFVFSLFLVLIACAALLIKKVPLLAVAACGCCAWLSALLAWCMWFGIAGPCVTQNNWGSRYNAFFILEVLASFALMFTCCLAGFAWVKTKPKKEIVEEEEIIEYVMEPYPQPVYMQQPLMYQPTVAPAQYPTAAPYSIY